ncbi:hypothetical protein [Paludibaculum fermentans]|uniref:Uncharacterized protein n=1 Tax=Paludibaculum fermentans TaxID=1473598 RepID=A0A7S7NNK0_PALFE|nr:hypothetical protein [Paludibaculum fermentans]QOY86835.1 hypothetical protein IRI77_29250 [Paludibaculum fermentans]
MLGSTHLSRWGQRVVAGTLLVLYSLLLLLPLAAASPERSMSGMACCRTGKKCCCRKTSPANAILSNKSCGGQCGQTASATRLAAELFPPAIPDDSQEWPAAGLIAGRAVRTVTTASAFSLRQRPPPLTSA